MISREGLSGRSRFFYNSKNQQIRTETEEGQVQENRYDAEGLRYEVRENANRIRFVYHQGELLYEKGGEESSYHLGGGTEAVWQSEKNHYYHQDEQLSTAFITNEKQEIQNHYQYDAFGNGICKEEGISNRIRYTGQQYDGVTGQYYLRARYYNPIPGRFLQEDVYQGDGLNLYAYCGNNPVRYYDPSGYSKTPQSVMVCPNPTIEDSNSKHLNSKKIEYPDIIDIKTGKKLEFPEGDLNIIPEEERVNWYRSQYEADMHRTTPGEILCKKDFIDEWYKQGYETPEKGWSEYEIHHIKPKEYGGSNSFDNLTPILRDIHRKYLNPWWRFFGGDNV